MTIEEAQVLTQAMTEAMCAIAEALSGIQLELKAFREAFEEYSKCADDIVVSRELPELKEIIIHEG